MFKKLTILVICSLTLVACESTYNTNTGVVNVMDCSTNTLILEDGRRFDIHRKPSSASCKIPKGSKVKFTYDSYLNILNIDYEIEGVKVNE